MTYIDPWGFESENKQEIAKEVIEELPDYRRGRYQVNMKIYDGSILHHRTIRTNDLGITVKFKELGNYDLNTNWLFKENVNVLRFMLDRLKGVHQQFTSIYKRDDPKPFNFNLAFSTVSGGHLNTIRQSRTLLAALKSMYAKKFDTRMLIIILMVVGMMGVYLLYSMGYIDIESLKGLIKK